MANNPWWWEQNPVHNIGEMGPLPWRSWFSTRFLIAAPRCTFESWNQHSFYQRRTKWCWGNRNNFHPLPMLPTVQWVAIHRMYPSLDRTRGDPNLEDRWIFVGKICNTSFCMLGDLVSSSFRTLWKIKSDATFAIQTLQQLWDNLLVKTGQAYNILSQHVNPFFCTPKPWIKRPKLFSGERWCSNWRHLRFQHVHFWQELFHL